MKEGKQMQEKYGKKRLISCVLITSLAALFLYLLIDYQIFSIPNKVVNCILSAIEKAEEDVYRGISVSDPEYDEDLYRYRFLKKISDEISGEGIYFYGSKKGITDVDGLDFSNRALKIYNDIEWGSLEGCDFVEYSAVQAFWVNKEHRLVFVYYPILIVFKKYFLLYLVYIAGVILLDRYILFSDTKTIRSGRFNELMSSTLITGFSHELKTPLAILKASVENWNYIDDADKPEYLEKIGAEVDHLDGMVHKLVGISDVGSGRVKMNKQDVDLYLLVQEVYEQQKPVIEERKLSVKITADHPEGCIVRGDREMLRIAVGNFISNAVKYSAREITIELVSGSKVALRVSNDGASIDKNDSRKVWKLFYKNDEARTDRFGSSGVGLAVTGNILKAHRAKYGCASEDNRTTFWFEMNRCKAGKED